MRAMWRLPSAPGIDAPSPVAADAAAAPTDRHARTGGRTQPGLTCSARSKLDCLRWFLIAANGALWVGGMGRARLATACSVSRGGDPRETLSDDLLVVILVGFDAALDRRRRLRHL